MSNREDIAAAASTVDGITCAPYFDADTTPGTAHVRLDRVEYPNTLGGVAYWDVVLMLPQGLADSERFIEAHVPALVDALADELTITAATPQRLDIPGVGVLPVAFVSGNREF